VFWAKVDDDMDIPASKASARRARWLSIMISSRGLILFGFLWSVVDAKRLSINRA
jgi:hypothetical protein